MSLVSFISFPRVSVAVSICFALGLWMKASNCSGSHSGDGYPNGEMLTPGAGPDRERIEGVARMQELSEQTLADLGLLTLPLLLSESESLVGVFMRSMRPSCVGLRDLMRIPYYAGNGGRCKAALIAILMAPQ